MVVGGADSVRNNSIWIAVAVTVAGVMVLIVLLAKEGWGAVAAGKPVYASGDLHLDYTLGFEILVATVLSWWPYMGGVMRMGRSSRQAMMPSMICLGMITGVIALIGLYASLATGDPDPSVFFVKVLGMWLGIIAIIFIALANIGTAIVGIYASAIGLKQIPALQYRLSYRWTALIVMLPVIVICAFFQDPFMNHILTFMYFLGLVFAPICAIQIVDFYVFRKNTLHLPSLFDYSRDGKYFFWGGINPAAFIATAVDFVLYYWLLNPVTYAQHFPFKWISASVPTIIASAIVYWLLTRFWIIPTRKGGYATGRPEGSY
jgi:NCS1 family nucleobase:cation symporter-1